MYIISKLNESVNQKGSSLSLLAHPSSRTLCVHYGAGGRVGARATPFLAALFAKQKTKFGGGKARAGKNSFPPTPFLFARPSENYQKSASGFSRKKVRILFKTDSPSTSPFAIASWLRSGQALDIIELNLLET